MLRAISRFVGRLVCFVGRLVCAVRGHRYFYQNGCINSWCAYSCVRCGELSRPLESLPYPPDDYEYEWDERDEETIDRDLARCARWVPFLPFPRWI